MIVYLWNYNQDIHSVPSSPPGGLYPVWMNKNKLYVTVNKENTGE